MEENEQVYANALLERLSGRVIGKVAFDFQLRLLTEELDEITFDAIVLLTTGTETYSELDVANVGDSAVQLVSLLRKRIIAVSIDSGSSLRVLIEDAVLIATLPSDEFETWSVSSQNGMKIFCMPGGELAIWSPLE